MVHSQVNLSDAFVLPWACREHSRAATHWIESEERAISHGLLSNDEGDEYKAKFRAFVSLDTHVYPYASLPRLSVVGGFNQWLYFLDDQYDDHPESHGNLARIRALMERGFDLLCGGPLGGQPTPFDTYSHELHREMSALASAGFFSRFLPSIHDYLFRGSLPGLRHWLHRETLPLEEYLELRKFDSGVYPVMYCIEIASGQRIPEDVYLQPAVSRMLEAAVMHVALANDIFSFEKETLERGSTVNLVHVLREQEHLDIPGAAMRAIEIVNGYMREFVVAEGGLPRYGGIEKRALEALVVGMKTWMSGHVDFSLRSRRFRSTTSPFWELRSEGDTRVG